MATGTADVAILISQELAKLETLDSGTAPHAVVGIDPSTKMLDVSRRQVSQLGLLWVNFGNPPQRQDIPDLSRWQVFSF